MQGFNMGRYVPPEHEGTTSANKLAGKHALGARANKSAQGILTVRFEMPFPIWCTTCPKPTIIGQGVRFNAQKKKVGNYYSTPIFSFRMKHSVCGGWLEIRTDPKNTAYVVTEGAKKRDTGEGKEGEEGEIRIKTDEERERLLNDAFASLEGKVDDKRRAMTDASRIEDLKRFRDKDWDDPYAASRKLRRSFRVDRKIREKNNAITEALQDRMSLGMELLEENDDDRRRAGFVDFGEFGGDGAIKNAQARPLFDIEDVKPVKSKVRDKERQKAKNLAEAEDQRKMLRQELRSNTMAAMDPFLLSGQDRSYWQGNGYAITGLKRNFVGRGDKSRPSQETSVAANDNKEGQNPPASALGLADYDSD
ncbi:MAG: hypothetical protein M1827_007636 [Pycnora praestabilis]|nr:MAG: hypothetical protein M1827_007636 [Pycnora praestabilis]